MSIGTARGAADRNSVRGLGTPVKVQAKEHRIGALLPAVVDFGANDL